MNFIDWLSTCTKNDGTLLSKRTVEHYDSGFKIISREMIENNIISKPLEDMDIYEYEVAMAIIMQSDIFIKKNKKGNNMYSNALKRYRCFLHLNDEYNKIDAEEIKKLYDNPNITKTEKEMLIKARIGQGDYRKRLLKKYNYTCLVTGINLQQVLVASHIKPWAVCNNDERLDVNNGLILSATYDRLFDSGLITFDIRGRIKLSRLISRDNAAKLNIRGSQKFDIKYDKNMLKYLDYHNKYIFVN